MLGRFKYILLCSVFCSLTIRGFAQQGLLIKGVVFEKGEKIRIALADVKNTTTGFSTGSNDMGLFSLRASVGDTLLISKRNFNDLQVVVVNNRDLVLYMNKGATLNEVVITGKGKKQALEEIRKDFKDKGSFYGGKPPLGLLLPFGGSPLTFFYELFGKTPKQARRFNRMYVNEMQDGQVDQLFNKAIINQQTGLTGRALENFMVNYRPTYEQAKTWTNYDGLKWINDSYKKYTDTAGKVIK